MKTANDVLSELTGRTNINNINNTNNINYSKIVADGSNQVEITPPESPLAPTSSKVNSREALASTGTLPTNWSGVKLDLFDNINGMKLKITITRNDKTTVSLVSSLSSPNRHVYRGRDLGQGTAAHWALLEWHQQQLTEQGYDAKLSKVGQANKKGTIEDFACAVYFTNCWHVDLIYDLKVWSFDLTGAVSDKFTAVKGIATVFKGQSPNLKRWISGKELGI